MRDQPQSVQSRFRELRTAFAARVPETLDQLGMLWPADREVPVRPDGLLRMRQLAHGLTGAGATFGFDQISQEARELEARLQRMASPGEEVGADERASLEIMLGRLRDAAMVALEEAECPAQHLPGVLDDVALDARLATEIVRAGRDGRELVLALVEVHPLAGRGSPQARAAAAAARAGLAAIARARLRRRDHIGRSADGGLALLLPDTGPGEARQLLAELRRRFAAELGASGASEAGSFRCGLASYPAQVTAKDLRAGATAALEVARRQGGDVVNLSP